MEAPRIPSIFKIRSPKTFAYKPFYFDPKKEERERRNRLIKAESDIEQDDSKEAFKSRIRERWEMSNYAGKRANSSNFRLIVIIMALMGIAYFLLK